MRRHALTQTCFLLRVNQQLHIGVNVRVDKAGTEEFVRHIQSERRRRGVKFPNRRNLGPFNSDVATKPGRAHPVQNAGVFKD